MEARLRFTRTLREPCGIRYCQDEESVLIQPVAFAHILGRTPLRLPIVWGLIETT